jgi:hypothetical protein
VPTVALVRLEVEIVTVLDEEDAALIVIEYVELAVLEFVSVAVMVMLDVPAAVGVPEMTPALLSDSPAGIVPVDVQVYVPDPPVAAMVLE